jgi:hypothetical protein
MPFIADPYSRGLLRCRRFVLRWNYPRLSAAQQEAQDTVFCAVASSFLVSIRLDDVGPEKSRTARSLIGGATTFAVAYRAIRRCPTSSLAARRPLNRQPLSTPADGAWQKSECRVV